MDGTPSYFFVLLFAGANESVVVVATTVGIQNLSLIFCNFFTLNQNPSRFDYADKEDK